MLFNLIKCTCTTHSFVTIGEMVDDVQTFTKAGTVQSTNFSEKLGDGYDYLSKRKTKSDF